MIQLSGPQRPPASGGAAKKLIIFLHGLGADGSDLIDLAFDFASAFPDAHFLSPNAPFHCDMAPYGYQWFSLKERTETVLLSGIREAEPILNNYIDTALKTHNLTDKDVTYIGFSQGTMMALHTILRRPTPCAALLGFSGALVAPQLLAKELKSRPNVMLIHGDQDNVVPIAALDSAVNALTSVNVPVSSHICSGLGHGIDQPGIRLGKKFIKTAYSASPN
jgi:phospholipase/carboxylesterase